MSGYFIFLIAFVAVGVGVLPTLVVVHFLMESKSEADFKLLAKAAETTENEQELAEGLMKRQAKQRVSRRAKKTVQRGEGGVDQPSSREEPRAERPADRDIEDGLETLRAAFDLEAPEGLERTVFPSRAFANQDAKNRQRVTRLLNLMRILGR